MGQGPTESSSARQSALRRAPGPGTPGSGQGALGEHGARATRDSCREAMPAQGRAEQAVGMHPWSAGGGPARRAKAVRMSELWAAPRVSPPRHSPPSEGHGALMGQPWPGTAEPPPPSWPPHVPTPCTPWPHQRSDEAVLGIHPVQPHSQRPWGWQSSVSGCPAHPWGGDAPGAGQHLLNHPAGRSHAPRERALPAARWPGHLHGATAVTTGHGKAPIRLRSQPPTPEPHSSG